MLSPNDPVVIEEGNPIGLSYWVRRCSETSSHRTEYYIRYRDVSVTLHPKRAALVSHQGREVLLGASDNNPYMGKGWLQAFCKDIDTAVDTLLQGGGDVSEPGVGEQIRAEIARRQEFGGLARPPAERTEWVEWLENDELTVAMGAWLVDIGGVSCHYNLNRQPILGFHPTNDEFESTSLACRPTIMYMVLRRLAEARSSNEPRTA